MTRGLLCKLELQHSITVRALTSQQVVLINNSSSSKFSQNSRNTDHTEINAVLADLMLEQAVAVQAKKVGDIGSIANGGVWPRNNVSR